MEQEWLKKGQEGTSSYCVCCAITLNMCLDFFSDGVTKFDEHFLNTQKDRQVLELSQIIPQLAEKSTPDSCPSKRTRFG